MIAAIVGTLVGTLIALVVWEVWRNQGRVSERPSPEPDDKVRKLLRMTPEERAKALKGKP